MSQFRHQLNADMLKGQHLQVTNLPLNIMLCERQAVKLTDFAPNLSSTPIDRVRSWTCRDVMQTAPDVGLIFD